MRSDQVFTSQQQVNPEPEKQRAGQKMWGWLKHVGSEMGQELNEMRKHGAHELAAALFHGHGFVMYPRGQHDDQPKHGLPDEPQKQQERGGRER